MNEIRWLVVGGAFIAGIKMMEWRTMAAWWCRNIHGHEFLGDVGVTSSGGLSRWFNKGRDRKLRCHSVCGWWWRSRAGSQASAGDGEGGADWVNNAWTDPRGIWS